MNAENPMSRLLPIPAGRGGRKFDAPHDLLPATLKDSSESLDHLDRDVRLSVFDFLDIPRTQGREVSQLCRLGDTSSHAKAIDILTNKLSPFHGPQLARNTHQQYEL